MANLRVMIKGSTFMGIINDSVLSGGKGRVLLTTFELRLMFL